MTLPAMAISAGWTSPESTLTSPALRSSRSAGRSPRATARISGSSIGGGYRFSAGRGRSGLTVLPPSRQHPVHPSPDPEPPDGAVLEAVDAEALGCAALATGDAVEDVAIFQNVVGSALAPDRRQLGIGGGGEGSA